MSLFSASVSGNYDKLAYDFTFKDLNGDLLKLSQFKNKIIVNLSKNLVLIILLVNVVLQINMKICKKFGINIKIKVW